MSAWPPRLLLLLAAGCAAAAGWLALRPPPPPDPPFAVGDAVQDLGDVPLGDRELTFRVTNPADRPRRIIGLAEG